VDGRLLGRDNRPGVSDDPPMREFRPPVQPSVLRSVIAFVLPLVVAIPLVALVVMVLGISRPSYTLGDGALVVQSGDLFSGKRTIQLSDVSEVRVVALRGWRRTAGTALPGLCAGRFTYPDLGAVWQVTDCGGSGLLLRNSTDPTPVVISPPDPQSFADRIRAGTPTVVTLPPPDKSVLSALVLIMGPLGIATVLMVSLVLVRGPGRMVYRVGDGALEVETLFSRNRWPTAGARAKAHTPSGLRRVAGTAAPGYYTGRYRESGESTRVFATDVSRVLLFEGQDRVILSPEDRVAMLRALEDEGAAIERPPT
jgi:hypothetical protein